MFEKNELKDLEKRIEAIEKLNKFVLLPGIENLMDEAMFRGRAALGTHPLRMWLNFKLCEVGLPDEARQYLQKLLEKTDFSNYRSLRR